MWRQSSSRDSAAQRLGRSAQALNRRMQRVAVQMVWTVIRGVTLGGARCVRHGTRLLRWRPDKSPQHCTLDQIAQKSAKLLTLLERT